MEGGLVELMLLVVTTGFGAQLLEVRRHPVPVEFLVEYPRRGGTGRACILRQLLSLLGSCLVALGVRILVLDESIDVLLEQQEQQFDEL